MAANRERANGREVIFRVRDVHKEYQMGEVLVAALRDATLDIYEGEFAVILGPSGSGKSTLLNIIGGIDKPTRGEVFFRGEELTAYSESQLTKFRRRHIGFVFQFYNLMPNLTARENVEMATEIATEPLNAGDVLGLVGLGNRQDHFPSQMSGGEQQRVAIARAVSKRPDILLCDEPTGALDLETGKIVLSVLKNVHETMGSTVVVITHNATIGGMADRVVRIADGRVRDIVVNERRKDVDELEW